MINNRQTGRRRGRGGQRPQGNPGQPGGGGNRIDNRARGNAQQLHEKYRNLARDSQMAGDRVTTEYYLQFADHYFRVLSESRARFDDQRRPRDDQDEEFDGEDEFEVRDQGQRDQGPREQGQRDQAPRDQGQRDQGQRDQGQRRDREPRRDDVRRDDNRDRVPEQMDAGEPKMSGNGFDQQSDTDEDRPRRAPRRRRDEEAAPRDVPEGIGNGLPPAIGALSEEVEPDEAPRRRVRRPRAEPANDPVEVPPAA